MNTRQGATADQLLLLLHVCNSASQNHTVPETLA